MILSVRQRKILDYLQQYQGVLSSRLLSETFSVSVQTIRKDMNELSNKGMVRRVHGGISLPNANENSSFTHRELIHRSAKQRIAQRVANDLPVGCSIFLGIGTTPKQVATALLDHQGLTVVTNNINAALTLSRNPNITVHLAGGLVRSSDEDTVGDTVSQFYRQFNIKIGIFGVGGLMDNGKMLDFSQEEAHLTRTIINNSQQCWLVVDKSKLDRYAPIVSGHLCEIKRIYVDQETATFTKMRSNYKLDLIVAN